MNKVRIPDSISSSGWNGVKGDIAKDKTLAPKVQAESTKMTTAVGALDKAHSSFDSGLGDPKGLTAATAATALGKFDAAAKSALKAVMDAATAAGAAASSLAAALDKAGKEKGTSPATLKVVNAAKATLSAGAKDAAKFGSDMSAAVDAARAELEAACQKLKGGDKKPAAPAKASPKALADGKVLSALMRRSIAILRTPKGSPVPIKFMVLFNKANPKDLRLYLGPKPESGLAKLKTQFPSEVKVNRVKDPKGTVVWEKGALTFLSDILKPGLAKQIQLSIRQQTKVTVKVRIKRSDGAVDEADAKDVSDDELKVSPAEEAEMVAGGRAYETRLKELDAAIQAASKGPNAAKVKSMVAAIQSAGKSEKYDAAADGLDELESLLEEGDVAESDGKDLQADPADKNVDSGTALKAKLDALGGKIKEAIARKNDASKKIEQFRDGALQLLQKGGKDSVDNATKFVNKIEEMLGAAAVSTFPAAKVEAARTGWIKSRDTAIKEITNLSKAIAVAFAAEATQKKAVAEAVRKLGELQIKLQTGLDNELNMAIKAKDPDKQADLVDRAKDSLASLLDLLEKDELLKNLDNNEVVKTMSVVGPMKNSLKAIEAALG
jgi:hypothetical protein